MQCTRVEECTNCFVYELSNNFVPNIGSASKKHPLRKNVGTMRVCVYTKRFKKWFFFRRTYFTWLKKIKLCFIFLIFNQGGILLNFYVIAYISLNALDNACFLWSIIYTEFSFSVHILVVMIHCQYPILVTNNKFKQSFFV